MLRVLELTECQSHCETAVFSVDIQNVYGYELDLAMREECPNTR